MHDGVSNGSAPGLYSIFAEIEKTELAEIGPTLSSPACRRMRAQN
jgi:hypothetical protein